MQFSIFWVQKDKTFECIYRENQGPAEGVQWWDILKIKSQSYTTNRSAFDKKRAHFLLMLHEKYKKEMLTRISCLSLDEIRAQILRNVL